MCRTVFNKLLDELLAARTEEEVNSILYRMDGVDLSFQHEKLNWNDHQRLFKLAGIVCKAIEQGD